MSPSFYLLIYFICPFVALKKGRASSSREEHLYRLVSVVEHFGTVGSGHYTVYRRVGVQIESSDEDPTMWFSISDSVVSQVSQTDVLHAEATLLFYEKMSSSGLGVSQF